MGAIPLVLMQLVLVVVVIFFPETVTAFLRRRRWSIWTRSRSR